MILTQQTCGHRSRRVAGSRRRALAIHFSERIWYMFSISQNVEESHSWILRHLQKEYGSVVPTSDESCGQTRFEIRSRHCTSAFFLQVLKSCTDLDLTLLYILILKTHTKFVWENKIPALGVCFLQPCSSDVCRFAASRSLLNYYEPLRSFLQRRIR